MSEKYSMLVLQGDKEILTSTDCGSVDEVLAKAKSAIKNDKTFIYHVVYRENYSNSAYVVTMRQLNDKFHCWYVSTPRELSI